MRPGRRGRPGRRWGPALLAVLALLLAGCAAPAPPQDPPPPVPPGVPPAPPPADANGTGPDPPTPLFPSSFTLWLAPERDLGEPPPDGMVHETYNFLDPRATAGNQRLAPWVATAPLPVTLRATAVRVDLVFSSEAPQASTSAAFGFQPVVVWLGQDGEWGPTEQIEAPPALQPGQVVEASHEFALPPGGLVLEAGSVPAFLAGFGYGQSEAAPLRIHVGPNASRLSFEVEPVALHAATRVTEQSFQGTLNASYFGQPAPGGNPEIQAFPLEVTADTLKVEARLAAQGTAGPVDVDLRLADPSGEVVWVSSTPFAEEAFTVHDRNLGGPGTYALQVVGFTGVQATFTLVARVHEA